MERISIIEDFRPANDPALLAKAAALTPALGERTVLPAAASVRRAGGAEETLDPASLDTVSLGPGDALLADLGDHCVGYLTLDLGFSGSHPDAPAYIRMQLAEDPGELLEDPAAYHGWISRSWIQTEELHVDVLPARVELPRRYAFRYLRLTVLDVSRKYRLTVRGASCRAVSAVDPDTVPPLRSGDPRLDRIDAVGIKTLAECMQEVFEDGPKRDRRLWLGDFRLQALVDYASFRHMDLVKRCLYLFAGSRFPDGRVSACLFTEPDIAADDTWFSDYALFYPVALEEYLARSEDDEALEDLYETAVGQLDISLDMCGTDDLVSEAFAAAAFIDWAEGLEKAACAQAVLIYALRYGEMLAARRGDEARRTRYAAERGAKSAAALGAFWDETGKCFVSNGQRSVITQTWMVLAGVLPRAEAARLLTAFGPEDGDCPMATPYMHHYYVSALLAAGLEQAALEHIRGYWGGMLDAGADTFWEVFDPRDPAASPYGGRIVNSFCHAWSCTPAYLLREYYVNQSGKNSAP